MHTTGISKAVSAEAEVDDIGGKVSKYRKNANNGLYKHFGEVLQVVTLKYSFGMIFKAYPANLSQFGACDQLFQLATDAQRGKEI